MITCYCENCGKPLVMDGRLWTLLFHGPVILKEWLLLCVVCDGEINSFVKEFKEGLPLMGGD